MIGETDKESSVASKESKIEKLVIGNFSFTQIPFDESRREESVREIFDQRLNEDMHQRYNYRKTLVGHQTSKGVEIHVGEVNTIYGNCFELKTSRENEPKTIEYKDVLLVCDVSITN